MQAIERLSLTPQHSLHLVSVSGRVLLIAVSPGGCSLLDGSNCEIAMEAGWCRDESSAVLGLPLAVASVALWLWLPPRQSNSLMGIQLPRAANR